MNGHVFTGSAGMLDSVRNYVYNRREGLSTAFGFVGGLYVAKHYLKDRLEEVKVAMEEERAAKDVVKRRFAQTQEDVAAVVLDLMGHLADQVLDEMDVEALTAALKELANAKKVTSPPPGHPTPLSNAIQSPEATIYAPKPSLPSPPPPHSAPPPPVVLDLSASVTSTTSSLDIVHAPEESSSQEDGALSDSDVVSASHPSRSSTSFDDLSAMGNSMSSQYQNGAMQHSWVVEPSGVDVRRREEEHEAEEGRPSPERQELTPSPAPSAGAESSSSSAQQNLSSSVLSISGVSDISNGGPLANTPEKRTKSQLWREINILTFTRALTTLYSTTLLSLLVTTQYTILARSRYLHSLVLQAREERVQEKIAAQLSVSNLLFQGLGAGLAGGKGKGMGDLENLFGGLGLGDDDEGEEEAEGDGTDRWDVSEDLKFKYLCLSWWLLHVGWKDVAERVRRAVEEVFEGVALSTRVSAADLHRLISDVRRRVEHEFTFEKTERRTDFLSTLLPPTIETVQHTLSQAGYNLGQSPTTTTPVFPVTGQRHDLHASSTSLSSSQLSHNFYESPAMGLSVNVPAGYDASTSLASSSASVVSLSPPPSGPVPAPPPQPQTRATYVHQHQQHPNAVLGDAQFMAFLNETRGVLGSVEFQQTLGVCVDASVGVLMHGVDKLFLEKGEGETGEKRLRLAAMLPWLAEWGRKSLRGFPNEVVDVVLGARETAAVSAIVFARFEEMATGE